MLTFTAWPEMLAWPYLMLHGWLPYRDIAIAHNPLLLIDLLVFYKLFGVGILQLKIYTWVLIALNTYLTFFISKKYWSKKVGILSSILYLVLCIIYQGNGLWFDLALTPFALLLYFLVKEKKLMYAGIIFALGFLTKQTFIYFAIPVGIVLIKNFKLKIKELISFVSGLGLIVSIFIVALGLFEILDDYYAWAIKFGVFYLPTAEGQILFPSLKQLLFAFIPFGILFFNKITSSTVLLLIWIIVGVLGVYPRWELFHFQPALPFLAIAISIFVFSDMSKILKVFLTSFILSFMCLGVYRNVGNNTRFFEPEVKHLVESVDTLKVDEIYVVNYWDNIYVLTRTTPSTKPLIPYIPWYLNYEASKQSIIEDLKIDMPDAIVIGERDIIFPELYSYIDKFYSCNIVEKKVELCEKNK